MVREVAERLNDALAPDPLLLALAVAADLVLGDPVYPWHPIRVVGRTLAAFERALRALGAGGYGGGVLLFLLLAVVWVGGTAAAVIGASRVQPWFGWAVHLFLLYSLLALGDLLHHVWRIESAVRSGDLASARRAVGTLVGRDTDRMDPGGCRRAAVESLSENLTDGFVSPVFWYVLGGVPGVVLFKIVSTMDSMVGYKSERYLRFGWCGARLDDVMNYVPARLTWLIVSALAALLPSYSGRKAWRVGLTQHTLLLGPNSGWSEAATAGALARRIVGPIWRDGVLVTDLWIGVPTDPPLESGRDMTRAMLLVAVTGLGMAGLSCVTLSLLTRQ